MRLFLIARFYSWGRASTAFNQIFIKRIMTFSKKSLALAVISRYRQTVGLPDVSGSDVIHVYIAGFRKR